jgi:tubulin-specific chaperone C
LPKKKFAFVRKPKKQKADAQATGADAQKQETTQPSTAVSNEKGNHLEIKDLFDQPRVQKSAAEYAGKENVIIENLESCTVILPFKIKCMYIKNIKSCKIYVGAISGASFINEASDSQIFIQSHQIRIHNSMKVNFYLSARSNPIIEHCCELNFGPFINPDTRTPALSYSKWQSDATDAGLDFLDHSEKNLFNKVLDFNWHKQDKSPNWTEISCPPQEQCLTIE